jgi:hypothetical protein
MSNHRGVNSPSDADDGRYMSGVLAVVYGGRRAEKAIAAIENAE